MNTISYAKAQSTDIAGIQQVAAESWRATYANIFTEEFIRDFLDDAYNAPSLARSVQDEQACFVVAKVGEQIIGFGHGGPSSLGAMLYRLYLLPAYWRQGVGGGLLERVEAWFRENKLAGYSCYVHSQNEIGKAFYQKQGFVHVADKDQEGEWCLWKNLT
ncbi:MAG: GNAT family N-acetyltransferase [Caldilineaceae bacterium]